MPSDIVASITRPSTEICSPTVYLVFVGSLLTRMPVMDGSAGVSGSPTVTVMVTVRLAGATS